MSIHKPRIPLVAAASGVEVLERLLRQTRQTRQTWKENSTAATDANRAQQQANSPTDMKPEGKDTFRAVADDFVSEEQPVKLEHGPVASLKSDEFLVCDAMTGIPFIVEEAVN